MEIKSCCINNLYFCVWQGDSDFSVEDLVREQKVSLSWRTLFWIESELQEILKEQIHVFYSKKKKLEEGFVRLAKFRTKQGWFVEIAWWPSSGGRRNLHIPAGIDKKGWLSFADMIKASLKLVNQSTHVEEFFVDPDENLVDKPPSQSFVEVVKAKKVTGNPKINQEGRSFWVKKESEVVDLSFNSLFVVTRLMEFFSWSEVKNTLNDFFQDSISINPFFDDKAIINCCKDIDAEFLDRWIEFGRLHLKMERWSKKEHSLPSVISCYGGWISINNLPLPFWKKSVFQTIGHYLGGLVEISSQTLNCLECSKAVIKIEKNKCGFIPAFLPIEDPLLGKFVISFEKSEPLISQNSADYNNTCFSPQDFSNSLDINRIKVAMTDEGFSLDIFEKINYEDVILDNSFISERENVTLVVEKAPAAAVINLQTINEGTRDLDCLADVEVADSSPPLQLDFKNEKEPFQLEDQQFQPTPLVSPRNIGQEIFLKRVQLQDVLEDDTLVVDPQEVPLSPTLIILNAQRSNFSKLRAEIKCINAEAESMAVNLPISPLLAANSTSSSVSKEKLIPSFSDLAKDKEEVEKSQVLSPLVKHFPVNEGSPRILLDRDLLSHDINVELLQPTLSNGIKGVDLTSAFNSVANGIENSLENLKRSVSHAFTTPQHKIARPAYIPSFKKTYSRKRGGSFLSKDDVFNPDTIEVRCTIAQVPALIRKQAEVFCSNHGVIVSNVPVPNGKFNLKREVPSITSPKNLLIDEDYDVDSLASVSSEEPEILAPNSPSEQEDSFFGKEVADLFQTPPFKQSPQLLSCKFSLLKSHEISSKFSSLIETCGLKLGRINHHNSF